MRIALVFMGVVGLFLWRPFYCGSEMSATIMSASVVQQRVVQQLLNRSQACVCSEIRVGYRVKLSDGFVAHHIAYYNTNEKTLRIETDPGSGWAFGWDQVDEQLLHQVSLDGGQFTLFTKYRPRGSHIPIQVAEPF